MQKRFMCLTFATMIAAPSFVHAGATDKEKERIKKFVHDRIEIKTELIDNEGLAQLSSTRFFEVKLIEKRPGGAVSTETLRLFKEGDEFKRLDPMGSSKPCEQLMKVFEKKIIIQGAEDAKRVEAALDLLYPVGRFDVQHKKIYQDGDQWTFVRGDIFDKLQGFQFTVDNQGVVTAIHYTTAIKKE